MAYRHLGRAAQRPRRRPVVIGAGPCGLFATLVLAEMGLAPILLERGKVVRERKLFVPVLNGNMLMTRQSYPHRPDIASKDISRLYFVGDTTRGEGCSGDIAFSSALKLSETLS